MKKNICCETCKERLYAKQIPIFKSLSMQELEKIINLRKHIYLKKGEVLVQEGSSLDKLFIVSDGAIKITKITSDGKEQIINLLSVGDFLGETNVLAGANVSNISAIAMRDSQVCTIAKSDLENLIKQQPMIALALLDGVSKKLMELQNITTHLSDNPESRIACMLIEFCEKYAVNLNGELFLTSPLNREEMANYCAIARETMSRKLSSFEKKGLIKISGKIIVILDKKGIENFL